MRDICTEVVEKIRRNRISTTEIADCLDKSGALPTVHALNRGHHRVGPVFWTYAYNESNWELHEQVRAVPAGSVVLTHLFDCQGRAVYGELVCKYLLLYCQAAAVVVCGPVRDAAALSREQWPIWAEGVTPIGCFNRKNERPLDDAVLADYRERFHGAVAVCDDTGVVVIPKSCFTDAFLTKLDLIEEQEDIWFDCIDRRKWDTFDTVCRKRYLTDPGPPMRLPGPGIAPE